MSKPTKLSKEMLDCLDWLRLNPGWHSSYGSPWTRKTLEALYVRKLVAKKAGLGSMASPAIAIKYCALPHPTH